MNPFVQRVAIPSGLALAVLLVWFRRVEAPKGGRFAAVPVVVAGRDMPGGVRIGAASVRVAQWPAGTQPAGASTTVDSAIGRVLRADVFSGEAIVSGRLAPLGRGAGLEVKIAPGKRAYGVRVDDVAMMAGLIQRNSRVDVMVVFETSDGRRSARLFLANVRVLAVERGAPRTEDGRPVPTAVATLEVTPAEAERLATATTQGQLQLVLRGYGDPDSIDLRGATVHRSASTM